VTGSFSSQEPILGQGLFVSKRKLWERQRKLLSPSTHRNRLKGYAQTMVETGTETVEKLNSSDESRILDLTEELTLFTSDIITRTMFEVKLGERNQLLY
tara:strand:+ start:87 stop:383 length:297 start_codon:yes stop_codon:yes gene_type:complete